MKHLVLAAALALGSSTVLAQNVETPKHKCEPKPEFPGRSGMQAELRRSRFEKDLANYKTCMMAFIEERKAVLKANEAAANAAIQEFNATMKALNEAQEAARD